MNIVENGTNTSCEILTSSSADLTLLPNQNVIAAYLYWAGSGNGDFNINLNTIPITAERTFSDALDENRVFFAAFADVTEIIQNQGNGTYTLSNLDLTNVIQTYCESGTNFAGWAISVIYEDTNLPLNQMNVYDGLQSVPNNLTIILDNLNVLDNDGAKIGFISWEGDKNLAVNETLTLNGNIIGNPPLNPLNNAFNGTNSFTGSDNLYNMDIDYYGIQNNINIGDTTLNIALTSGQDFVMINNVITVLNSQSPDASISIDGIFDACNSRSIEVDYTVYNTNATDVLPANTPITFYANNTPVGQRYTPTALEINTSESYTAVINIPIEIPDNFTLTFSVDDDGTGQGTINEISEENNTDSSTIEFITSTTITSLNPLKSCNTGFNSATFNLSTTLEQVTTDDDYQDVSFYLSLEDLQMQSNEILNIESFQNTTNPQTIFMRIEDNPCYNMYQFEVSVENCPPTIPQGFSPNNDGYNDWFNIIGLYDIFERHELLIYNRFGTLIFKGHNNLKWDGTSNQGLNNEGDLIPVGTYFYVLHLNHNSYKSITGWVYINY
ncbi:MAG: gliding motility-associated C-terminal domain-containing protein [Flavobacteriaceae bacterium]|nr:gliding motility-associated C-terminal domain-containing protein [Flavobacteriaceae bacterium]